MQKFIINITGEDMSLLDDENLECFVVKAAAAPAFRAKFAAAARAKGKLVLTDDVQVCKNEDFDGVLADFSRSENIAADFKALAAGLKKKFVGLITRNRRHEAMLVSECEPDFVAFRAWREGAEQVQALTSWYAEMFLLQSALLPEDDDLDFTAFATDFVILDDIKYKIFVAKK